MKNIRRSMPLVASLSILTVLAGCDSRPTPAVMNTPTPTATPAVITTPPPAPGLEEDRGPSSTPPSTGLNPTNATPTPATSPTI